MKPRTPTSVLAIQFTRDRLVAVEMRVRGTRPCIEHAVEAPLRSEMLNAEPELAGREILSRLESAGIRTRRCVLCLPVESLLIQTVSLAGVAEEDLDSLLALEAERGFPVPPEDLVLAYSRYVDPSGKPCATLAAVANSQVEPIVQALRRAKLHVVSVTAAPPAFLEEAETIEAALVADADSLALVVNVGAGLALLRSFAVGSEPGAPALPDKPSVPEYGELGRELRLTLRRLPPEVRSSLTDIRLFGFHTAPPILVDTVENELKEAGIRPVLAGVNASGEIATDEEGVASPTVARVASRYLSGRKPVLEFWQPREPGWRSSIRRLLARGVLVRVGLAAGFLAFLLILAFSFQGLRLATLESRWKAMQPEVDQLTAIRDGIRLRRPWTDPDPDRLEALRTLTTAFPESGSVWARSVEIRESNTVECLGFARSNRDCLSVLESLRTTPGVADLQVDQVRGDNPVQFSFQFKWQKEATQ